jgi:hypothetical protein
MNTLEHNTCTIAEGMKSNEIEALIAELQIIADRKYQEEEEVKLWNESIINNK